MFMCCHPALSRSSAIALTLRAVGGPTTREIAGAFLVPEATMAQRISRAKQRIRSSGVRSASRPFDRVESPRAWSRGGGLGAVLRAVSIFNEGYATSSGPAAANRSLQ